MIKSNLILGLSKLAATHDVRYYLNSIYYCDGELIATDGNILGILKTDLKLNKNFIIPLDLIKNLKRSTKTQPGYVDIAINDDVVSLTQNGSTYSAPVINTSYPNFKKCIPDSYQAGTAFFDIALIAKLHAAIKLMYPTIKAVITPNGEKSRGSMIQLPDFTGLIMPIRVEAHIKTWRGLS